MMENSNDFATGYAVGRDSTNGGYGNGGMFGNGNDWAWIVILLLFGWGGRGFGGFGGGFGGGSCGALCATQADVRSAVDQQTLISKLDQQTYGLADSTYAINNAINNGFFGVQSSLCQGFNGISREVADCCCSTKSAIADVKYTIANEGCETRHALFNNTRDIIDNANANSRAILDFLTQDKIATLTAENQSLKFAASQSAQNAFITANQEAHTAELIRRLGRDCPVPAYVVPNPNCCYNANVTFGNGCGCGSF
ncbi:MAG: hypothetical protein U0L88_10600 [Acutalibacteraceae bacterium]|nr:hypothetical protein [Acutalibacteraceae bacterium]